MQTVGEIMSRYVRTVRKDTTLLEALHVMVDNRISGLPVVDETNTLVGIVTEGDLLRRSETDTEIHRSKWLDFLVGMGRLANEYVHAHGQHVSELMTSSPRTVEPGASLKDAVELMVKHHIRRLPVLKDGRLVGIVSRTDLITALLKQIPSAAAPMTDDQIAAAIKAQVEKLEWAPRNMIGIAVKDGIVEFTGAVFADSIRNALRVLAENLPGVKGVVDHMIWVDPMSGMVIPPPDEEPAAARS